MAAFFDDSGYLEVIIICVGLAMILVPAIMAWRIESDFWKAVEQRPSAASVLFAAHGACLLDDDVDPLAKSQYAGPYYFNDGSHRHRVYILELQVGKVYASLGASLAC
ncbi:hypothetical protein [Rhodopseudomonas sp.]|uniref:hypothetical protein n=1 Tax=Rhodopseudomonas sp. TaxID=1078 RepID=UPI0039E46578